MGVTNRNIPSDALLDVQMVTSPHNVGHMLPEMTGLVRCSMISILGRSASSPWFNSRRDYDCDGIPIDQEEAS